MRVAIIGAGISGLSCAIELQKHGITPDIFEKTKELGDKPGYLVASLRLFYRSIRSPMSYLKSKYGIQLTPLHPIKEIVMHAPHKSITTKGNHGYVFLKGIEDNSLEHQLAAYIYSPIMFDTDIKIQNIKNDYDYIIVANGSNKLIREYNSSLWTTNFQGQCRIATIFGEFGRNSMHIWLNKSFAKDGYGYIINKNPSQAELVLAVSNINQDRLDYYWDEFLTKANVNYHISKFQDLEHVIGYPSTNQYENLYFVGNSGGMIDDFMGFGMTRALESGIMAARAIVYRQDFDKLLRPFKKEVLKLHEYRKMMDLLNNKDLDQDMSIIGIPVLKHLIYNNPLYKAKYGILAPMGMQLLKKRNYPFDVKHRN